VVGTNHTFSRAKLARQLRYAVLGFQLDVDPSDTDGELDSALDRFQRDAHAVLVPHNHSSLASEHGEIDIGGAVETGKVRHSSQMIYVPMQEGFRCPPLPSSRPLTVKRYCAPCRKVSIPLPHSAPGPSAREFTTIDTVPARAGGWVAAVDGVMLAMSQTRASIRLAQRR
jgi:hypothetical protein